MPSELDNFSMPTGTSTAMLLKAFILVSMAWVLLG